MMEEEQKSEDQLKKILIGGWHPHLDPDLERIMNMALNWVMYGIIFFLILAVIGAMQYNEYMSRAWAYAFITAADCSCKVDSSILMNRSIALPNPANLPGTRGLSIDNVPEQDLNLSKYIEAGR